MTAQTSIVGNITRAPELRFTGAGLAVASFGVAVNRKKGDEEVTSFFDVTAFGTLAEHVAELPKGCRVIVVGRLEQSTWEKDGEKRSKVAVVADEVGPSLRWATASVERTSSGSAPTPGARRLVDPDEEPFVLDVHDDRYEDGGPWI